ncbi:site-specific integrase [Halorussus limi]|uniref:Site-specific integrase n=1 Tax=Halorussus limi TaxID=2938695 RepID=A0A8U0HPC5_9EURY|nr:site-specific integrase [Halorussus limi]UPV72737.1 site-specific integrase [Halorussus limi]
MLEPTSPREAVNEYLAEVQQELAAATAQNHKYRLDKFLTWTDEVGLDDMNEITGSLLQEFKQWLMGDVAKVTVKNHLSTVRQFVEFCEDINVAPKGVGRKIRLPTIQLGEDVSDVHILQKEAEMILEYCEDYEYATLRHTAFYILWHTGMRASALTGLDIGDYDNRANVLSLRHRPDEETPLKNKERSERDVYINDDVASVLDAFLDMHHPYVEDEYGRMPLLGGTQGRLHYTTIQRNIYTVTRPCHYTNECPHDRDLQECEATSYNTASKCPSSVAPHALRKGAATALRKQDVPKEVASERLDMSGNVLDKHYDKRTKREKMELRREYLNGI